MARIDAALDFDNALPDAQAVQKHFLAPVQEKRVFGGENVIFVLQAEIDLRVAIAQDIDWEQGRMLGDVDQALAKTSNFTKHIFQAVARLFFHIGFGKQIVDFLQENDMAQFLRLALGQTVKMNPAENDFAEKDSQGLGQFLIQLNDDGALQQFLQFDRMPGIEGARGRAEGEGF